MSEDPRREWATSFGADAERYERARPSYPTEMVAKILAESPGRSVLDVGCGTGISSRLFQEAGATVLGVEVDADMAEVARGKGLDVELSRFEVWDPAGRLFDAVVAGQAWHWIDPVAGAAVAKAALRPGGRLAPFWNVGQPQADVTEAFSALYREIMPGPLATMWERPALDGYAGILAAAADGINQVGGYGQTEQWHFEWDWTYSKADWIDQVPTHGGHNQLGPGQLMALLAGVGTAIEAVGGSFTMHYTTVVVTAVRLRDGGNS